MRSWPGPAGVRVAACHDTVLKQKWSERHYQNHEHILLERGLPAAAGRSSYSGSAQDWSAGGLGPP